MTSHTIFSAKNPADIRAVVRLLLAGGVVVLPTDTVYGLSCGVLNVAAVERLYRIKERPLEKQVPVLLSSAAELSVVARDIPRATWALVSRFWPGPLTLVLPAREGLPGIIRGASDTVAVRVPAARSCLDVLEQLGQPVVGTSANVGGRPPATVAAQASQQLGETVDAILEDDGVVGGTASTIVEVRDSDCVVHREGVISSSQLHQLLGIRMRASR